MSMSGKRYRGSVTAPCCGRGPMDGTYVLDTRTVAGLPDGLCVKCHNALLFEYPELGWTQSKIARAMGETLLVHELRAKEIAYKAEKVGPGATLPPTISTARHNAWLAIKDTPVEELEGTEAPEGVVKRLADGTWVRES